MCGGGGGGRGGEEDLRGADSVNVYPSIHNCCIPCLENSQRIAETAQHICFVCPAYADLRMNACISNELGDGCLVFSVCIVTYGRGGSSSLCVAFSAKSPKDDMRSQAYAMPTPGALCKHMQTNFGTKVVTL